MASSRRFAAWGAVIVAASSAMLAALSGSAATAASRSDQVAAAFSRCPTSRVVFTWYPNGDTGRGTPDTLPKGRFAGEKPPDPRRPHITVWRTGGYAESNWLFYAERPVQLGGRPYPEYSAPDSTPCRGPGPAPTISGLISHARSAHGATALRCRFASDWSAGIGGVLDVIQGSHDQVELRAGLTGKRPTISWDASRCTRIALP